MLTSLYKIIYIEEIDDMHISWGHFLQKQLVNVSDFGRKNLTIFVDLLFLLLDLSLSLFLLTIRSRLAGVIFQKEVDTFLDFLYKFIFKRHIQ